MGKYKFSYFAEAAVSVVYLTDEVLLSLPIHGTRKKCRSLSLTTENNGESISGQFQTQFSAEICQNKPLFLMTLGKKEAKWGGHTALSSCFREMTFFRNQRSDEQNCA